MAVKTPPPPRELQFNHLSIEDLLAAREQYHVYLSQHPNVVATAIGRYLMRKPGVVKPHARVKPARTLANSRVDPAKSWPCVLVFVSQWKSEKELVESHSASGVIPRTLYLRNGREVPVCVVEAPRELETDTLPLADELRYPKSVLAGGYPLLVNAQGWEHMATVGCIVTDGSSYYALTNRHVCGEPGRVIQARLAGAPVEVGVAAGERFQLGKLPFSRMYPGWPGDHLTINADVGLVEIDDITQWRTDIFRLGPMGALLDYNVENLTLDVIGKSVVASGAGTGDITGQVSALFYRYRSVGGMEFVADYLIGPRGEEGSVVRHGDSGAVLLLETERGRQPFAIIWGMHEFLGGSNRSTLGFAMATGLGNVCRLLDVDLVRGWNLDQPYTWGKTGHFKIGFRAADLVGNPDLAKLLRANQDYLGYANADLVSANVVGGTFTHDFVPLADVADIIWRTTRPDDEPNHFCDIDETDPSVYGGECLLDLSMADANNIDVDVWLDFDQKMDAVRPIYKVNRKTHVSELRPREGGLPFRVWQMYKQMIASLGLGRIEEFLVAGGTMAHYVGDACQPLHISYLHHGADASESAVHSDYETTLIDRKSEELFKGVDAIKKKVTVAELIDANGKSAAKLVLRLMKATVNRLPPEDVLQAWRDYKGRGKYDRMWKDLGPRTIKNIAAGSHTMAILWQSAWKHGGGSSVPASKLRKASRAKLQSLYEDKSFVKSYRLSDVQGYKSVL